MTIRIHWASGSPYSWRVLLALEIKGIPFESRLHSFAAGDLRLPTFRALNPRGKVPVMEDGDFVLTESLAILAYIERKHPDPPLFGRDAREAGRIMQRVSEYASYLDEAVERFILPLYYGHAHEKEDQVTAAAAVVAVELERLERSVGDAPWLAGDAVSAADVACYPGIMSVLRASAKEQARAFDLRFLPFAERHPRLSAWRARMEGLPGYERTVPPHWKV